VDGYGGGLVLVSLLVEHFLEDLRQTYPIIVSARDFDPLSPEY
jgi:hypothetical protein